MGKMTCEDILENYNGPMRVEAALRKCWAMEPCGLDHDGEEVEFCRPGAQDITELFRLLDFAAPKDFLHAFYSHEKEGSFHTVLDEDEPRETSGGDPHQLPRDGRAQGAVVVVIIVTASSRATRTITLLFVSNEVCASTEMCTRRARGRCVCVH